MDPVRVGRQLRALRQRRGWRQADLARAAGTSQSTVARIEGGDLEGCVLRTIHAVAHALAVRIDVRIVGSLDAERLIDAGHAAIVEEIVRRLRQWGWIVEPEVTFSVFGERGSIDVLAFHPATRVLLVIEVKTAIGDVQAMLSTLDRKVRLAPRLAADRRWRVAATTSIVVLGESRTSRRILARHAETFGAALPLRGRAVLAWLRRPTPVPLRGLVFLTGIHVAGRKRVRRVRRAGTAATPCSTGGAASGTTAGNPT